MCGLNPKEDIKGCQKRKEKITLRLAMLAVFLKRSPVELFALEIRARQTVVLGSGWWTVEWFCKLNGFEIEK